MKAKVYKAIAIPAIAAIATLFAATVASSACGFIFYQPREPKCLKSR